MKVLETIEMSLMGMIWEGGSRLGVERHSEKASIFATKGIAVKSSDFLSVLVEMATSR